MGANNMYLALDIDGVIANCIAPLKVRVSEHFGMPVENLKQGDSYNNIYAFTDEKTEAAVNKFIRSVYEFDPTVYADAKPIAGSRVGSNFLARKNILCCYITRRSEIMEEVTLDWLAQHNYPALPVHFIPKGICKSEQAFLNGIDYIVEDSPHELDSCLKNGLKTIAMHYHYNDGLDSTHRVKDWPELLSLIGAI